MTARTSGDVRPFYLDHNACTPVLPDVLERFVEVERRFPANPGAVHAAGRAARGVLEEARLEAAEALQVDPERIEFVSGGTEANNQALRCFGELGAPVLLASTEHASVRAAAGLRGSMSLAVDPRGRVVIPDSLPARPGLVALAHAQSELGTLQPVAEAAELARGLGVPLHVDAAQTPGRVPLDEVVRCADSIALSAHKCGGLRGGSILVTPPLAANCRVESLLVGGGQERGLRSGTPSVALAAATGRALALAQRQLVARAARMKAARDLLVAVLTESLSDCTCLTPCADALPNTAMMHFGGIEGRLLLPALDVSGIHASHGSACASGSPEPPAVLESIGLSAAAARACVRFSFGPDDDVAFAEAAARRVVACVASLQQAR